jgi:hypothetical protein
MTSFLVSFEFTAFVLPLLVVLVGVFIRVTTRSDHHPAVARADLAVGLDVALSATVAFAVHTVVLAQRVAAGVVGEFESTRVPEQLISAPWVLLALVFGMWAVSTVVRKFGWRAAGEPTWACGVVLPLVFGMLSLGWVASFVEG